MNDTEREKLYYIDVLKGMGILMVILGHASFHRYATYFVYLFHMPLFFIISGFLDRMKYDSLGEMLKKKSARLLYPYIVFGILIIVYNTFMDEIRGITTEGKLKKRVIALLYGNMIFEDNSSYIGVLWFLVCLFFAGVFAYGLWYLKKKSRLSMWMGILLLLIMGHVTSYVKFQYEIRLPWCIDVAFVAAVFYLLGTVYRKWEKREQYETTFSGVVLFLIGILLGILNMCYMKVNNYLDIRVDMLRMNYGILPMFVLSAVAMTLGLMIILKKICKKHKFYILARLGKMSLLLMVVHVYILQMITLVLNHLGCYHWLLCFPAALMLSILTAIIIERFLPYLFDYKRILKKETT